MLYSNKIKPYSFVNPNLITVPRSGMASAVKSGGGVFASSSKRTLLGLNRLGASLTSLGKTQSQIRDVLSIQLKTSKDVKAFKLRKAQYFRDQESERRTELAGQKKGEVVDKEEVKKEGEKKLSWLEKLLGPFKGIVEFALRTIITQGILRWISDPKNGERLQKVVSGLSKFFGFVFGIVSWSIGSFMSGISNVFGDGSKGGLSRFAEILGGLGQIIVGIAGLKAASYLLNPFSLISDILGLIDVISSKGPSGGDVPQGKPGAPSTQSSKAAQKVAENYGDDAARLYDDAIKRGRSPAAALGDVRKKFTKLPPKPTGLFGKMKEGFKTRITDLKSAGQNAISNVKQFGAKAFDLGKAALDRGKDLTKSAGGWIKNQAGNIKNLAALAKNPEALGAYVRKIVAEKIKPTIEKNDLVKRLLNIAKDPKNIGKNIGPLVKDALKSKQVKDLSAYLKQVQGKAKIGGLDTVIAALTGLLDYGVFGSPFINSFLGAIGGLLGYSGGFALGAPFGGVPGFIAGAAGGIAGEHIGRSLARLLGKGALGKIEDPLMKDGRMLADPALAEGGLITKPTRALIGERGPEIVIPLAMMGSVGGIGPIAGILHSALSGALSAMGSSGELAKQVVGDDLAEMQKQSGGSRPAQPGETLGKSVVKGGGSLSELELGSDPGKINQYIGDKSSYGKKSSRNTLRGALANILGVFESITKKSFSTGGGGGGTGGGGGASGGDSDVSGISLSASGFKDLMIETMNKGGITNKNERIMFMAQVGHESGDGKYLEEIASGADYEGRSDLGNTQPGDGKKFKGRGYIQITGRANYKFYGPKVGVPDATENPKKLAEPNIAAKVALAYWMERVNRSAAQKGMDGMNTVTKNINGGLNGLDDRIAKFKKYQNDPEIQKAEIGGKVPVSSPDYKEKWSGDGRDEILKKFSAGGKSIIEGAKKIIGAGRGVSNRCADTTRQALKAAGHPAANKRTQKGDLDTPKGTAFNGADLAASFGGSDMGTVIKDKSQIKMGDIILWKADKDLGGSSNKGAITHVGIAADDGLKHQYDHNVARGWHYRPHWDSAGGTSWFAAIRLGGSGTIGPGESTTTSGSSSVEEKEMTPEEQLKSIISKMTADIMKLNNITSAEPQSTVGSSPAAVKPVPNQNQNLDNLSAVAAALEEDSKPKVSIIPIPTAINSGSASAPTPQPPVVRARTPITYGF
jgi:putative chitinase